ncbi:hypothetical protein [Microbacterium sp. NPDC090014]|uniref:hypothetical protein n=1 Tax=Microbacterium sp. NPDC090014 TaxID=3364205 RepID=UPI00380C98BE
MNATQLEARVMQAIDAVRAGSSPEDDRIEFKRGWPGVEKARQLAAAANQAQGEHVIYVLGIDDKTGIVSPLDDTDPADWWARMEMRFDQVAPDLQRHVALQISESERVVALLFRTDRAPYLVKVGEDGGGQLEVPIRSGTRTRSAKRHELLRMLYPAVAAPELLPLSAQLTMTPPQPGGVVPRNHVAFHLSSHIYFEHVAVMPAFLPWHAVTVTLEGGRFRKRGSRVPSSYHESSSKKDAVQTRDDGLRVSESGVGPFDARWAFRSSLLDELQAIEEWVCEVEFEVAGSVRGANFRIQLRGPSSRRFVRPDGSIEVDDSIDWLFPRSLSE